MVQAAALAISIHAPLAGSDGFSAAHNVGKYISIHAPLAGSDFVKRANAFAVIDFNPRSPCGERHGIPCHQHQHGSDFNPRSPCGERLFAPGNSRSQPYFNPRSPCGERHIVWNHTPGSLPFQSTLPLRGATLVPLGIITKSLISIHAPLAGSDQVHTL